MKKLNYLVEQNTIKVYFTEGTKILNGTTKLVKEFSKYSRSKAIKGNFNIEVNSNLLDMIKSLVTFAEAQNIEILNLKDNKNINVNLLKEVEEKAKAGKQVNILDLIEEAPTAPAATHGIILEEKHTNIITGESKTYKPAPGPQGELRFTIIQKNLVVIFKNAKGQKVFNNDCSFIEEFTLLTRTFPLMGKFTIREDQQKIINHLEGFAAKHNLILVDKRKPESEVKEVEAAAPEAKNNIFVFYTVNKTFSIHIMKDFKLIDPKDPIFSELINKYKFIRHSDSQILKITLDINIINSLRRSVINYANRNGFKVYDFKGKHFISIDKESLRINMENAPEETNQKIKAILRPDLIEEEKKRIEQTETKKAGFYVEFNNELTYFEARQEAFKNVGTLKRDPANIGKKIKVIYVNAKGFKKEIYSITAAAPEEKKEVTKEEKDKDKKFKSQLKTFTDIMAIDEINKGAISELLMEIIDRVSKGQFQGINNRLILIATLFINNIDLKYLDNIHTYAAWKKRGYQVQKGEKAAAKTSLWIKKDVKKKDIEEIQQEANGEEENNTYTKFFLKASNLFTIDQVKEA